MRYFFHIRDHAGLIADEEGSELPNMAAARQEARATARDFAMNDLRGGGQIDGRHIEIVDAKGRLLESVAVRDVALKGMH